MVHSRYRCFDVFLSWVKLCSSVTIRALRKDWKYSRTALLACDLVRMCLWNFGLKNNLQHIIISFCPCCSGVSVGLSTDRFCRIGVSCSMKNALSELGVISNSYRCFGPTLRNVLRMSYMLDRYGLEFTRWQVCSVGALSLIKMSCLIANYL